MPLKNWCSIHARCSKSSLKHSIRFCCHFSKFKTEFYCISFFQSVVTSRLYFEIYQLWQSGFSRVYSSCSCSFSFEPEIIKIRQSSHKMYTDKILNFQASTTILSACTKRLETYWRNHVYLSWVRAMCSTKSFDKVLSSFHSVFFLWGCTMIL